MNLVSEISKQVKEFDQPVRQIDQEHGARGFGFFSRQKASLVISGRENWDQPLVEEDEGKEDDGGGEPVEHVLDDLEQYKRLISWTRTRDTQVQVLT